MCRTATTSQRRASCCRKWPSFRAWREDYALHGERLLVMMAVRSHDPLVPLPSVADGAGTPTSKSVPALLVPGSMPANGGR